MKQKEFSPAPAVIGKHKGGEASRRETERGREGELRAS